MRRTSGFRRDYKREKRANPSLDELLVPILTMLLAGEKLPVRNKDHPLSGNWSGYRDCHLKPDLVLIYKRDEDDLVLVRLGSHAELFD
ncbi:type II toxin-antitoxin system YafQ family toxin [Jiella avicenniae]|uniref:type II toxin-antitoxin system YafQ family toxin n=1 Tax=Jiella avicenniae TaxID=2907202 RepID=UPI001F38C3CF